MDVDITVLCPPPDPKTQPKITNFFHNKGQTKITSFFSNSPSPKRPRKRASNDSPGPSTSSADRPQSKAMAGAETEPPPTKRKVGRPRKTDPKPVPAPQKKRGRPKKVVTVSSENESSQQAETFKDPVPADIYGEETVLTSTDPTEEHSESPSKKHRRSFTVEKKLEVVEYAKKHSLYRASLHYKLSSGTIGPWMKKDFSKMDGRSLRASGSGRKLTYPPKFEPELAQWILEQHDLQPGLSTQEIINHACALIQPTCPAFKGTRGWFQKFLTRNGLINPDMEPLSRQLPSFLEENVATFLEKVKKARSEYDYPMELIGNMDEVSVQVDMVSNRKTEKSKTMVFPTYTVGGEKKSYTIGAEKQHITVVLTALADGTLLPPVVIFKGVKTLKHITAPSGWLICVQENGQLDSSLIELWIKEVWLKHTQGRKALLIMDSCHPHCEEDYQSLLTEGDTTVFHIPPGCSSKLQPVAISLATPFKKICTKLCSNFYESKLQSLSSPDDRLRSASKLDICPWLVKAYAHLTKMQDAVASSFKAVGLSLALDGSEDRLYRMNVNVDKEQAKKEDDIKDLSEPGQASIESVENADFGELDGTLKTLYKYMLQMQTKAVSEPETGMQLLVEHLQSETH